MFTRKMSYWAICDLLLTMKLDIYKPRSVPIWPLGPARDTCTTVIL